MLKIPVSFENNYNTLSLVVDFLVLPHYIPILDAYTSPCVLKTNLVRNLQAQTLPDATPQIGQIHPFSKMAITF